MRWIGLDLLSGTGVATFYTCFEKALQQQQHFLPMNGWMDGWMDLLVGTALVLPPL